MKKKIVIIISALIGLYIIAAIIMQFMKVVDNPPVNGEISAPAEVMAILNRSCYDCHSNKTKITWFQRLPIISSVVASDVHGARSILNFTEWNKYTPMERDGIIYLAVNAVEKGGMPPSDFIWIHPHAKITKEDKAILQNWLQNLNK